MYLQLRWTIPYWLLWTQFCVWAISQVDEKKKRQKTPISNELRTICIPNVNFVGSLLFAHLWAPFIHLLSHWNEWQSTAFKFVIYQVIRFGHFNQIDSKHIDCVKSVFDYSLQLGSNKQTICVLAYTTQNFNSRMLMENFTVPICQLHSSFAYES